MRGFSDRTTWRAVEALVMVLAASGLYVGYNQSDEFIFILAACLAMMTAAHYQNTHF